MCQLSKSCQVHAIAGLSTKACRIQSFLGRPKSSPVDTPATSKSPESPRTAHLWRSTSRTHHSHLRELTGFRFTQVGYRVQAVLDDVQRAQRSPPIPPFVSVRHDAVSRYTIMSTSSALCRFVELSSRDFGRNSENERFPYSDSAARNQLP